MNIDRLLKDLTKLSNRALRKNDLALALKAKESQIKLFLEQKKATPLDVSLLSEAELDELILKTEQSFKEDS